MSVRRLAEDAIQPNSFAFNKDNAAWAERRMALYPEGRQQSAVIPLLMRAQEQEGWVTRAAIEEVARMLGMATIRVLEVATFYTQFQLKPVGTRAHVQVCGTTPCMLRGAEGLRHVCENKIHPDAHHTNADGTLSWEEVECLGACVNAPMVMIGQDTYEDLTPERLEEIIDAFEKGEGDTVPTGPQVSRQFSAPISGPTSLTEVPALKSKGKTKGSRAKVEDEPTTPGRKRDVPAEAAPALKAPKGAVKVSEAKAEGERQKANDEANANGKPNRAARETARGGGDPAGKIKGGKSVDKAGRSAARRPGGVTGDTEPAVGQQPLFTVPEGDVDDLKLIAGVGPVLEKRLHTLGVTQFAQIAAFKKADIERLDEGLNFKGRIARDDWVKQAKALAKGGVEEYRKVFGKDPR